VSENASGKTDHNKHINSSIHNLKTAANIYKHLHSDGGLLVNRPKAANSAFMLVDVFQKNNQGTIRFHIPANQHVEAYMNDAFQY